MTAGSKNKQLEKKNFKTKCKSDKLNAKMSLEDKISNFIDDILKVEAVEESFNLYIVHRPHLEAAKQEQRSEEWCNLLLECASQQNGQEQLDQGMINSFPFATFS